MHICMIEKEHNFQKKENMALLHPKRKTKKT